MERCWRMTLRVPRSQEALVLETRAKLCQTQAPPLTVIQKGRAGEQPLKQVINTHRRA